MDRRTMLAALATGAATWGIELDAQESQAVDPSLYIPKVQRVEDREFLFDFMDRFAFADVITAPPTLRITHIPTVFDRAQSKFGTIFGHVSAQNPQNATFDGTRSAVVVFHGPQGLVQLQKGAYREPSLYEVTEAFYKRPRT